MKCNIADCKGETKTGTWGLPRKYCSRKCAVKGAKKNFI